MSEVVKKLAELSKEAVALYVNKEIPLNEGIAKLAEREALNPDEIKRVVEASNTLTWLSTVKPQMDKTAEFSVASYPAVMEKLATTIQKCASYNVDGVGYIIEEDTLEKAAEEVIQVDPYKVTILEDNLEKAASTNGRRLAQEETAHYKDEFSLKCLYEETKEAIATTIEKIANNLSSVYSYNFEEFEKRAYSCVKQAEVKSVLDLILNECTFEKSALARANPVKCIQGKDYLYEEDKNIELLKEAMDYLKGLVKVSSLLKERTSTFRAKREEYSAILKGAV
jgi:hypothetical protein